MGVKVPGVVEIKVVNEDTFLQENSCPSLLQTQQGGTFSRRLVLLYMQVTCMYVIVEIVRLLLCIKLSE